jgi:hypothetical protein
MASRKDTARAAARLLRKARDLMNNRGSHWTQCELVIENDDGENAFCALGGIAAALQGPDGPIFSNRTKTLSKDGKDLPPRARLAVMALAEAIDGEACESFQEAQSVVVSFNDANTTKWGHVARKFRVAAMRLERLASA